MGWLNAATTTRPDLAYSVGILAQYMSAPSESHWSGVKRVLRYVKGTLRYGLVFSVNQDNTLMGYSDSAVAVGVISCFSSLYNNT